MNTRPRRAVGYCRRPGCYNFRKGTFLYMPRGLELCQIPLCHAPLQIQMEESGCSQVSGIFKEVRVSYNFRPDTETYRATAVVRDDSLEGEHNVFTLCSPMITSEGRAFQVAENLLAQLSQAGGPGAIKNPGRTSETVLSFDDNPETFAIKLAQVASDWKASSLKN